MSPGLCRRFALESAASSEGIERLRANRSQTWRSEDGDRYSRSTRLLILRRRYKTMARGSGRVQRAGGTVEPGHRASRQSDVRRIEGKLREYQVVLSCSVCIL